MAASNQALYFFPYFYLEVTWKVKPTTKRSHEAQYDFKLATINVSAIYMSLFVSCFILSMSTKVENAVQVC